MQANTVRGPSQTRTQMAAPQDARPKVNIPTTDQAVVQLLEVICEVTEEM